MKKRILYPGEIHAGDCVLLTGSINTFYIVQAANALKEGIRSKGYSCSTLMPGMVRPYVACDQTGDSAGFDYSSDVSLVIMGEYLGVNHFRQGDTNGSLYKRCVFFSPVANPSIAFFARPEWEADRIKEVEAQLTTAIGVQTKVAPTALLRPSGSEQALLELTSEAFYYLENGLPIPPALKARRELLYNTDGLDQIPALERALW